MNEQYDLVIIGAGPAGLSAGIYATRAKLKTIILEEKPNTGGQCFLTDKIENYPGFPEATGESLSESFKKHALKFGVELVREVCEKLEVDPNQPLKRVYTTKGKVYSCYAVIVSTGARARNLGCIGEQEHIGKGVSYCATCDGVFFEGKEIAVVGGGEAAVEEAIYLTKFAKKVTIIHRRDELRASKSVQEKAFSNPKIEFIWNSTVEEVAGSILVDSLKLKNLKTGETSNLAVNGVFVFVGNEPQTAFLGGQVKLNPQGYIITNSKMETNLPGVYAVGDVIEKEHRQVITACADGAIAGIEAGHYVDELKSN